MIRNIHTSVFELWTAEPDLALVLQPATRAKTEHVRGKDEEDEEPLGFFSLDIRSGWQKTTLSLYYRQYFFFLSLSK